MGLCINLISPHWCYLTLYSWPNLKLLCGSFMTNSIEKSSQCEQTLVPKSSIQTIVGMVHENVSVLGNSNVIYTVDQGIKLIMTLGGRDLGVRH